MSIPYVHFLLYDNNINDRSECTKYINSNSKNIFVSKPSKYYIVINAELKKFTKYIILVPLCSNNVNLRKVIRKTWLNVAKKMNYKLIFYMGYNKFSVEESFEDVIQFSFMDHYYNLTLSTALIYNWTRKTFDYYDYIMKVDSDVYPNLQLINLYVSINIPAYRTIYGFYYNKMRTCRNKTNPNYIPYTVYSHSTMPEFVAGSFYKFKIFRNWNLSAKEDDRYCKNQ